VMVPKRPSVSLLMPAVKNKVLAGPAPFLAGSPSFPKVSEHKPFNGHERAIGFLTKPMNLCVKPLNAAIHPRGNCPREWRAELAEIASRPHDAPGRVETSRRARGGRCACPRREELDEAESSATHRIVTRGVLLGIGDEEGSADVLHVEGSESARNALGFEGVFIEAHALESGVRRLRLWQSGKFVT